MEQKKLALFIDVDNLIEGLRSVFNRPLDLPDLLSRVRNYGRIDRAFAYGNFRNRGPLRESLRVQGIRIVETEPRREERLLDGQVRDILRDSKDVEMLADIFESLNDAPSVELYVLATGDRSVLRALTMIQNKFGKEALVCGVEGSIAEPLRAVARIDAIAPQLLEASCGDDLAQLVPLLEALETRMRHLNFKFIRDELCESKELSVDTEQAAEELLSAAIECGVIVKRRVEDKYRPGRAFTAYRLNRESALYARYTLGREPSADEAQDSPESDGQAPSPTAS